jgi:hypothetical protein
MKHLKYLIFVCFLLPACGHEQKAGAIVAECTWPEPTSDSVLLDNFRNHMKIRKAPAPFVPEADTMYRFRGRGGWGEFDYLCSVYCDSAGYKASITNMINRYRNGIEFEEKTRSIGTGEWEQIRLEFQKSNFWCDSIAPDESCTDTPIYHLLGKEGAKYREVRWTACEPRLIPMKILGKKIKDLCGFPNPPGLASYHTKGDSVFAYIFIDGFLDFFTQKTDFQYHQNLLPNCGGVCDFTLHKRDLDSLRRVIITEYGIDGSVRRINVTKLQQTD